MPPRTIDNLGVDVSTRYAEDQKKLDQALVKDSRGIGSQAQIDVTIPFYPSEFELLFEIQKRNLPWAEFSIPLKYAEQKKRLFTSQIIPSLGSDDKREAQMERIRAYLQAPKAKREGEEKEEKEKKRLRWEEEREKEEEEKEKKILLALLDRIHLLDKYFIDINSRRSQYQKG